MDFQIDQPTSKSEVPPQPWAAGALAEVYSNSSRAKPDDKSASIGDFAKEHWKEIAGVGVVLVAGTALVTRGRNLGAFSRLLRGGQTAEAAVGVEGATAATVGRLRNVKHFVFDMDRTLIDTDGALITLQKTMTDGLVKSSGLSREVVKDALAQTTKRLDSPYFWNRLDEIRPLQMHFPGVDLNQRFASVATSSKEAFYGALKPKAETVELLDFLRSQGKGVHVFTAGNPARALEKLNGAGLLNKVDRIYTAGANTFEDSGAARLMTQQTSSAKLMALPTTAKADGTGYQFIARDLRSKGARLAMTGDHPVEDIANAKVHNYFTSKATWYRNSPGSTPPDLNLTSPSEFTSLLRSKVF